MWGTRSEAPPVGFARATVAAALAATVALVGGCEVVKQQTSSSTIPPTSATGPTDPTTPPTPTTPTTTAAAVPPLGALDADGLAEIAAGIDALITGGTGGSTIGVRVVDADNGQVVYSYDADRLMTPASNTKLFTTASAMALLGPDHRMDVTAWVDAPIDPAGAVAELTVIDEQDFTWTTYLYDSERVPAERFADAVYAAGVRSVGALVVAGDYLVEGEAGAVYDPVLHRDAAAIVLSDALAGVGIAVGTVDTSPRLAPPESAFAIAIRPSMPLSVATFPLNADSHNEQADLLSRHLGWTQSGDASYTAGAAATFGWLDAAGIDTTGMILLDGSGASRDNLVSATQVVELLNYGLAQPWGAAWAHTFSIPGVRGTLEGRLAGPTTYGRFRGKTGTHNTTVALSGVLYHGADGHRYLVSVLQNDVVDSDPAREDARALADAVVEVVAADHRGVARPSTPDLRVLRATSDGDALEALWSPVDGADGYVVWTSVDGLVWPIEDARLVESAGYVRVDWTGSDPAPHYVRVTARAGATTSDPSAVSAASPSTSSERVLVVDAVRPDVRDPENPGIGGHDKLVAHVTALGAAQVDSASVAEVGGEVWLSDYDLVVWVLGEHGVPFDASTEQLLSDALALGGTALFVSGADLATDLAATPDGQAFLEGVLHVAGASADDAGSYSVAAEGAWGALADTLGPELGFYAPGVEDVQAPDALEPGPGATAVLSYLDGGGTAGVVYDDGIARVAALGFPFETLDDAATRAAVMDQVRALVP